MGAASRDRSESALPADPDARIAKAQTEVSETFGNIAAFWGFTRTQGRIYGLLFLSPEPLPFAEIKDRLGISAGSTSMTLQSLGDWGVVHRHGRLYVAETDLWKLITGVFRKRERAEIVDAIGRMSAVTELLAEDPDPSPRIRFALGRVEALVDFFKLGRDFLDAFVARRPVHELVSALARRSARFPALVRAVQRRITARA